MAGGGGGGGSSNATVSPSKAIASLDNAGKYQSISFTINNKSDSNTINAIKNDSTALLKDTDYILEGNQITLRGDYIASLNKGEYKLSIDLQSGTDPVFTLTKDTDADTITSGLVEPTRSAQPDSTTTASEQTVIIMKVEDFNYTINGDQKKADAVPAIKDSRTYIPYRVIAEAFDATVQWDTPTKTVSISNDEIIMFMAVGNKSYTVNGVVHQMDAEAYISNDRILVPVRFVAETLGAAVNWNTQTKVITITRPGI